MNTNPSLGAKVIEAVSRDASVIQLRAKFADFERRLKATQEEIAEDLELLNASLKTHAELAMSMSNEDRLVAIEARAKPTRSIETLREQIREKRFVENECAEGVRILRIMLRQREDAIYYAAFKEYLCAEQVAIGGRALDHMIEMAELWHQECELRAPLRAVGRFEAADVWAVHPMSSPMIRSRLEYLEKHGYVPSAKQLQRIKAIEQAEQ
jgi:hypothetical protein